MLCRSLCETKGSPQCRLSSLVCSDVAIASLENGCGIIRWAAPSRLLACLRALDQSAGVAREERLNGEEFFMPECTISMI
jgi:hypothetical protein